MDKRRPLRREAILGKEIDLLLKNIYGSSREPLTRIIVRIAGPGVSINLAEWLSVHA